MFVTPEALLVIAGVIVAYGVTMFAVYRLPSNLD